MWYWGYWIVVAKSVVLFIVTGIAKSFGVFIPTMVERLESDYATVGLICSLPATSMYLLSPFVTLVLKKINHRVVAMLGGVLCGSCIIASAFFKNSVTVGVCLALSGVGLSMTYMPTVIALNDFFREKFVLMNTITLYGYTTGSMLLPIIMERSFEAYGYVGAFIILGGIAFNLFACGATIRKAPRNAATNEGRSDNEVKEKQKCLSKGEPSMQTEGICYREEEEEVEREEDKEEDDSEECVLEKRRLIQNERRNTSTQETSPNARSSWTSSAFQTGKRFCGILNEPLYLFTIPINFLCLFSMYSWMLFLVPHAEHLGIPPSKAIFLSTIGGIGGIIGRTIFIILVGKGINVYVVYIAIGLIGTASFLLDFISSAYAVRATLAFVQGFSFFIEDAIMSSLFKDAVFDNRNFNMAVALGLFAGGLGATCAGTITGYLFDVTQSFTMVFIIVGFIHAVMVVNLFIVWMLIKRRRQDVSSYFDH
ncbi:monocarboxylate transporter 12-like [Strongylocentrotus purpuratus]|uniref:Monocarboxylate transporter n=1 Tax=Strongylocentrotus purpuratus TaxID=7668 RepID=A0A7M7PDY5_STRPU|nr:monocarboxylate transporter 12-like [Strongylocentrotus purpuratus]